jgi:hypothetical protein
LQIDGMPQRIVIRSASQYLLVARVRELGIMVQKDAPAFLLSALPGVRDHKNWHASEMPETPGWLVHQFWPYPEARWQELPQADARKAPSGFFRFAMKP